MNSAVFIVIFLVAIILIVFFRETPEVVKSQKSKNNLNHEDKDTNLYPVLIGISSEISPERLEVFNQSGETIWSGKPIKFSFTYKREGMPSQQRNVLVDRYFSRSGGRYFAGHCFSRNDSRSFKTSRIISDIYVESLECSLSLSKIQKGLRTNDLSFNHTILVKNQTPDHKKKIKIIFDGDSIALNNTVQAKFNYGSSSIRNVNALITHIFKRKGRLYLEGKEIASSKIKEFRADKIASEIVVNGVILSRRDFIDYIYENLHSLNNKEVKLTNLAKLNRRKQVVKQGKINWEKEGLLSLSGYHVGKSNGVKEYIRQNILSELMLFDDLSDITDNIYVRKWGDPSSKQRYKKITDTLKAFISLSEKRNNSSKLDLSKAIQEWRNDLSYMQKSYSKMFSKNRE